MPHPAWFAADDTAPPSGFHISNIVLIDPRSPLGVIKHYIRLAQWFLSLPFASIVLGSNPTSDLEPFIYIWIGFSVPT